MPKVFVKIDLLVVPRSQIMFPRRIFKIFMVLSSALASTLLLLLFIGKGLAASTNIAQAPGTTLENVFQEDQVISQTEMVFLPMIAKPYIQKSLGSVSLLSGPSPCIGATGEDCYSITVSCPNITNPINAMIKIGDPLISQTVGSVMFFSGFDGTYYWANTFTNTLIISDVRVAGFQTIQVDWASGWFLTPGNQAGMDGVACRPATVARWVYDTFHQASQTLPYCAVGHSNGATQVAYMLTHYGMDDILDETIFESGPNYTLLEHGCIFSPLYSQLYLSTVDRQFVDRSYGIFTGGPCEEAPGVNPTRKQTWKPTWQAASIASLQSLNIYPHTQAAFVFGSLDTTTTRNHGQEYSNWLALSGTPYYTSTIIPGANHTVTGIQAGKDWMTSQIINGCVLH